VKHEEAAEQVVDGLRKWAEPARIPSRLTPNEYATLIFYWSAEPHPELLDDMMAYLNQAGQPDIIQAMRAAGAVLAFEELNPSRVPIWRQNYPDLYKNVDHALKSPQEFLCWADFLAVKWMILRHDDIMRQLLDRAGRWGERDKYTAKLINRMCISHGPFRYAAERLKIPVLVQAG
jgi:hypothetical protein